MATLLSDAGLGQHGHCYPQYWTHEGPLATAQGPQEVMELVCSGGHRHVLIVQPTREWALYQARLWEYHAYLPRQLIVFEMQALYPYGEFIGALSTPARAPKIAQ